MSARVALVTGSSRGIGHATAVALAHRGARIVLAARSEEELADAAESVVGAGGPPRIETCDFGEADEIERMFDRLHEDGISIDVLVNNVGVARVARFEDVDDEEWRSNWELNVMSAVRCCRRALPGMVERGWGRVVNVSSSAGKRPTPKWSAYAPTKAALQGLTTVLAATYGDRGVTVNAVCPGPVRTPTWTRSGGIADQLAGEGGDPAALIERVAQSLPFGRMGESEEVAEVIAFLASEQASLVNGSIISVDGGHVGLVV